MIGIANGVAREATYGKRLSEGSSNQLSVLSALWTFAAYLWFLQRRWPIAREAEALRIGAYGSVSRFSSSSGWAAW